MLRTPLSALLVGIALPVLPAAAKTTVAASLLAGIISVHEQSTAEPRRPNTTIPEKIEPQEKGTTGFGEHSDSLSDKLDRSNGVLPPPADVDPGLGNTGSGCRYDPHSPARLARGIQR